MKKPKYMWIMTNSLFEILLSIPGEGRKEGEEMGIRKVCAKA